MFLLNTVPTCLTCLKAVVLKDMLAGLPGVGQVNDTAPLEFKAGLLVLHLFHGIVC